MENWEYLNYNLSWKSNLNETQTFKIHLHLLSLKVETKKERMNISKEITSLYNLFMFVWFFET